MIGADDWEYVWITVYFLMQIKSTKFYFQLVSQESAEAIRQIQEMLLKCNLQNKVGRGGGPVDYLSTKLQNISN